MLVFLATVLLALRLRSIPAFLGPMLAGLVPITVSAPLTGVGTAASPLGITNASGAFARCLCSLQLRPKGFSRRMMSMLQTPAYIAAALAALSR
jgi:hypothetical protein